MACPSSGTRAASRRHALVPPKGYLLPVYLAASCRQGPMSQRPLWQLRAQDWMATQFFGAHSEAAAPSFYAVPCCELEHFTQLRLVT